MKVSTRTKYVLAAPLFVVASLTLQFIHTVPTYAALVSWSGQGDGTSFSDSANWNGGQIPQNGDILNFSVAGLTEQKTLNNDLTNLSLDEINFVGAVNQYNTYTMKGNPISLTGSVSNSTTGANAAYAVPTIENNLTLADDIFITKMNIGVAGSTLNLQGHSLHYVGAPDTCGFNLTSNLSGNGGLFTTGQDVNVRGNNTSYTGPITVYEGDAIFGANSFGTTAGITTVNNGGSLSIAHNSNVSVAESFNFSGTGTFGAVQNFNGCSGSDDPSATLTLTGTVELGTNFNYSGKNNTVISGTYKSNANTFIVLGGSVGTITTADGEVVAPEEVIQLDGESSDNVNLGNKQTGVLNGGRNNVIVGDGAILKGTGYAAGVYVSEGGRIQPGNSPGTINVLASLVIGGTYDTEILNAQSYDQIAVGEIPIDDNNAVVLLSTAVLNPVLYDGWSIKQGDSFTIINNKSTDPVQGTFSGLNEGAQLVVDGITFSITYVGGDGNDVVLTALNEGTDPGAPNTGAATFVQANPAIVAGFGILAAGTLIALAIRRRNTQ